MVTTRFDTTSRETRGRSDSAAARSGKRRARGRQGASLGSARDRQRLRERERAERERVERMLASAPVPIERRGRERSGRSFDDASASLRALPTTGCPVCASPKIVNDEVMHGGTLRLWECLHCEHRWTRRPERRWAELGATMARGGPPIAPPTAHPVDAGAQSSPREAIG